MKRFFLLVMALVLFASTFGFGGAIPDLQLVSSLPQGDYRWSLVVSNGPDGKAYVFGGNNGGCCTFTDIVRIYDPASNGWETLPGALPYPLISNENHNAALASNGKIYISPGNGVGGFGQHNRIIEFDPATGTARERAAITVGNIWGIAVAPAPASLGGVYLFGGWNGGGIPTIWHYDPVADTVNVVGSLTAARTVGARVTMPNGKVYLFGANVGALTTVEVFDPATETVTAIPNSIAFWHGTRAWAGNDNMIYLWNTPYASANSAEIVRFNPSNNSFEDLGPAPAPGGLFVANVQLPSAVYFMANNPYDGAPTITSDVWRLDLGPSYNICLLYNPEFAKKSGSTYPIKLQLCDSSGANLSSPNIVVTATGIAPVSGTTPGQLDDSGNANPGNNFRYDSDLEGYIFNLKLTGFRSDIYDLQFNAGTDRTVYTARFEVK